LLHTPFAVASVARVLLSDGKTVMTRTFVVLVLGLFVTCWVSLCHGSEPWPEDINRIKQRGKLIVAQYGGVRAGFFRFDDAGQCPTLPSCLHKGRRLVGCDISLATQIAQSLGVKLQLDRSAADFNGVCRNVALGKADIGISKLSVTVERAQYVRFTTPYAVLRSGILVDRLYLSKAKIGKNPLEICNRSNTRIGIIGKSSYVEFARKAFPRAHLVFYHDVDPMLQAVLRGEVHILYGEELMLMERLHDNPKLALRLRFIPVPKIEDRIAIAVSPRCPDLLAFLNVFLKLNHAYEQAAQILKSLVPAAAALSGDTGKIDVWSGRRLTE